MAKREVLGKLEMISRRKGEDPICMNFRRDFFVEEYYDLINGRDVVKTSHLGTYRKVYDGFGSMEFGGNSMFGRKLVYRRIKEDMLR